MNTEVVIRASGLGKVYRIWNDPAARLKQPLVDLLTCWLPSGLRPARTGEEGRTAYYRDFHALRDLSLELRRGEAVGIIGRNGSGKSTLLQMVAGTLTPSSGTVSRTGRVAALLELGSGFNPDFTGRENVFINGAVLGLQPSEIRDRFDSIAEFAEIGEFIDQPIRTYSSGMVVRLAFAVAAHVDPDVLIVDEALGVGDARFQLKCARHIDRFLEKGGTLLFVSHDVSSVKRLCNHAILIEKGRLVYAGLPNDVTNLYSKLVAEGGSLEAIAGDVLALQERKGRPSSPVSSQPSEVQAQAGDAALSAPSLADEAKGMDPVARLERRIRELESCLQVWQTSAEEQARQSKLLEQERAGVQVSGQEFAYGGTLGRIRAVDILDSQGVSRTWFTSGENVCVRMDIVSKEALADPIFALTIKNSSGVEVYGTNTLFSRQPAEALRAGEERRVEFCFALNLMPGFYFLSFGFTHFFGEELAVIHRRYDAIKVDVHAVDRTFGIANLHARIQFKPVNNP